MPKSRKAVRKSHPLPEICPVCGEGGANPHNPWVTHHGPGKEPDYVKLLLHHQGQHEQCHKNSPCKKEST